MIGPAVTIVASGGIPVTNTAKGTPLTEVASGGVAVTLVASGGIPVTIELLPV